MENKETEKVLRCKASTDANKLAGSIYSVYQTDPDTEISLRVIGAGALNQAVKGVIISQKFFAKKGLFVSIFPSFKDTDGEMTAISLKLIISNI